MSGKYDVIVIGAGPGGYVAAIKAAKLGLKTAIIEERRAGGTCLNRGCIPAKAMIHASSLYREMQEAERFGISASNVTYDYGKIVAYKEETTDKLVQGVTVEGKTCTCHYIEKEKEQEVTAEYVLCAVGRCPNTDGLFGENVKPDMERGRVLVNENFESSIPGVYAIGDLIFGAQRAHAASAQGIVVAEKLAGKDPSIDLSIVPGCVYTDPEIASAGMTEDQAKEKGIAVKCGKFIMSANGKSIITQEERGFIKVVAEEATGKILGAQMMCARATDMIGEFVTAITNGLTVKQMLKGMRSHPTYNEGIGEALEELEGGAVHVVPRKKK